MLKYNNKHILIDKNKQQHESMLRIVVNVINIISVQFIYLLLI